MEKFKIYEYYQGRADPPMSGSHIILQPNPNGKSEFRSVISKIVVFWQEKSLDIVEHGAPLTKVTGCV